MTADSPVLTVHQALEKVHILHLQKLRSQDQPWPEIEKDSDWPSACEQAGHPEKDMTYWRPAACRDELDLSGVERALELTLHPDIKAYYTAFYSGHIPAICADGGLELLQIWNQDDFERLQQNIIGHLMMKQKKRQSATVFFAVTDDDEIILSVDNATGSVWAERVGRNPHRQLADNLSEFLTSLTV